MKLEYRNRYIEIGLKIAYYRKLRELTQEQLADLVGCDPKYLSRIETSSAPQALSLDLLFSIADVLKIPPYKLLKSESDD